MPSDDASGPDLSFGDFSIDGIEDPLAHRREEYIEEVDPDPAPLSDLVAHNTDRLPWFGATPWAGSSDLPTSRRRVGRTVALLTAGVTMSLAVALVIWRLAA